MLLSEITAKFSHLTSLRIRKIVATKSTKTVDCILAVPENVEVDSVTKSGIEKIIAARSPRFYTVKVKIEHDVWAEGQVVKFVLSTIASSMMLLSEVTAKQIQAEIFDNKVVLTLNVDNMTKSLFDLSNFDSKFSEIWCKYSAVKLEIKYNVNELTAQEIKSFNDEVDKRERIEIAKYAKRPTRSIGYMAKKILYRGKVNGTAGYISDLSQGNCVICGKISEISQHKSNKDDSLTIHKFKLTDLSATIEVVLFVRYRSLSVPAIMEQLGLNDEEAGALVEKNLKYNQTLDKRLQLHGGQYAVVEGKCSINEMSQNKQVICNRMQECAIISNTTADYLNEPSPTYDVIEPTVIAVDRTAQMSMFSLNVDVSKLQGDYVVLEQISTGYNSANDNILAIGCVKISEGAVVARMSTAINPERNFDNCSKKIGISPEQLKYCPTMSQVVSDIHKFCYGSVLVGSNVADDVKFLQYFADPMRCLFDNKTVSLMSLVKQLLDHEYATIADMLTDCGLELPSENDVSEKSMAYARCLVAFSMEN